jgi:Transposase IS116/IS110/IS902 family
VDRPVGDPTVANRCRGDPGRDWGPQAVRYARAVVKHAGLAPREKQSGAFTGRTELTGQGRPALRLAAWRAVWGAQHGNPVYRARYQHLTSRERNKLTPTRAQTVIAAAILRQLASAYAKLGDYRNALARALDELPLRCRLQGDKHPGDGTLARRRA